MNAEERAARKAAGKCLGSRSCEEKLKSKTLCERHLERLNEGSRRRFRKEYLRRKISGECVRAGCGNRQQETDLVCVSCRAKRNQWRRNSRRARLQAKRRRKIRRRELLRKGLCSLCGNEPLATKVLGAACAAAMNKKLIGPKARDSRCRECGEPGHNARTCGRREREPKLDGLRIEDYASARNGGNMEAAL